MNEENEAKETEVLKPSLQPNPLSTWIPRRIEHWSEWMRLWETARYVEERMGLLHAAFDLGRDQVARITFLLSVANGHRSPFGEGTDAEWRREICPKERQRLSQKAYEMLAQRFFNNSVEYRPGEPMWEETVLTDNVLDLILEYFLGPDPIPDISFGQIRLRNIHVTTEHESEAHNSSARADKLTREFLLRLVQRFWHFSPNSDDRWYRSKEEIRSKFLPYRPKFIYVLSGLRRLNVLLKTNPRGEFGDEAFECLRKLALAIQVDRNINAHTIEEAILAGSEAANVYLILQKRKQELERQLQEADLCRERAEALRRAEEIESQLGGSPVSE